MNKASESSSVDLDAIAVFVKVVQTGSFSRAARLLSMPKTTVSAKVARLERRLGVKLIERTTRKLHMTALGQAYFSRCARGLARIQAAESELPRLPCIRNDVSNNERNSSRKRGAMAVERS